MVGNLVLAVALVRDERFRPLLVVVVACLLPVVRMVVELVEARRILELVVVEQRRSRTALLKIEITRCMQFLEVEGLSSVHGCLASMDQAGFLSARSPLIFRRSIRDPRIQLRRLCEVISSHPRVTWKLRKSMLGRGLHPRVQAEVPMVVPSRAWVDEVKTLKQGDIYVGRGSKQRGLLPSFWANRYKASKFGRDRAVELPPERSPRGSTVRKNCTRTVWEEVVVSLQSD